ncbi:hypothetical protein GQ600_14323 [Phytophthora cactorum]|nr:hypothetical protein GQ600_14323 [Phytophthora cactorum]
MEYLEEGFGGVGTSFACFLMCFVHMAKKIYEKTRAFDPSVAAMVIMHVYQLHFSRNDTEYQKRLAVPEEWDQ